LEFIQLILLFGGSNTDVNIKDIFFKKNIMNKQISYKETIHLLILLLKNSFNLNNKPFFDFYNRLDYKNVSSILIKKYDLNPGLNKFSISQLALFIKCFIVSILRNNIKLTPLIFFLKLIQSTDPIEFHSLAFNKFSSLLIASRFSTKFVQTFEYQHGLSNRFSYEYILSKKVLPNVRRVPMKSDVHFLSNLFKKI
jgi:hypothetical protein